MGAVTVPTCYVCDPMDVNGVNQGDLIKALKNLWACVDAICVGLDASGDTYTAIKTRLDLALAGLHTPGGPTAA